MRKIIILLGVFLFIGAAIVLTPYALYMQKVGQLQRISKEFVAAAQQSQPPMPANDDATPQLQIFLETLVDWDERLRGSMVDDPGMVQVAEWSAAEKARVRPFVAELKPFIDDLVEVKGRVDPRAKLNWFPIFSAVDTLLAAVRDSHKNGAHQAAASYLQSACDLISWLDARRSTTINVIVVNTASQNILRAARDCMMASPESIDLYAHTVSHRRRLTNVEVALEKVILAELAFTSAGVQYAVKQKSRGEWGADFDFFDFERKADSELDQLNETAQWGVAYCRAGPSERRAMASTAPKMMGGIIDVLRISIADADRLDQRLMVLIAVLRARQAGEDPRQVNELGLKSRDQEGIHLVDEGKVLVIKGTSSVSPPETGLESEDLNWTIR